MDRVGEPCRNSKCQNRRVWNGTRWRAPQGLCPKCYGTVRRMGLLPELASGEFHPDEIPVLNGRKLVPSPAYAAFVELIELEPTLTNTALAQRLGVTAYTISEYRKQHADGRRPDQRLKDFKAGRG